MTTKWLARTYAFASANSDEEGFPGQLGDLGQSQIVEFNDMEVEPDVTDLDDSMTPVEVTSEPSKGSKNNPKALDAGKIATRVQPIRANRVVDPAGPDRPRSRRTPADVKTAKARRAQLEIELEELNQKKLEAMAELDVQEEFADENEEHLRVLADNGGSAGEVSMDGVNDVDIESSSDKQGNSDLIGDGEASCDKVPVKPKARGKKPAKQAAKGKSRQAIEVTAEAIKKKRKATAVLKPNVAKKQKSLFPSGLSRNWQAKNHGKNGTGKISAKSLKRDTELSPPSPPFEYGGLADEDASAEAPPALPPAKVFGKERNLERSNELVGISSDEEASPFKLHPAEFSKMRAASTNSPAQKKTNGLAQKAVKRESPLGADKVKREPSSTDRPQDNVNSNDGLPLFARAGWATRFLPTLCHRLSNAMDPWDIGDGTDILVVIQGVFDKAYPDSGYNVVFGSKIYSMAKDRLNDRRTLLGRHAIKIVDEYFAQAKYVNQPIAIAAFAKWAMKFDGPMIWEYPSPMGPKGCDYVKPDNMYQSSFMIALLKPFMKALQGSCHDYGQPQGAVALGAAALHRAFSMYKSGSRIGANLFSKDNVTERVKFYGTNTKRLTDTGWARLLARYGVESVSSQNQEDDEDDMDESLFQSLYIPSSPIRGS